MFVCSPNNPTGADDHLQDIRTLPEMTRGKALVVATKPILSLPTGDAGRLALKEYPHLVALRTLSKAFALARASLRIYACE
ncbi:aminotransferase class I/II-fold pyridoxal phosphate-dependent enzyme [Shigella flexneri]